MKNIVKILMVSAAVSFLSGCGEPTIDASSKESLDSSMHEIVEGLEPQQRRDFESAMRTISMRIVFSSIGGSKEAVEEKLIAELDGKTAEEIIELAKK